MLERSVNRPLQLGEPAPNVVLDAITSDGKIALDDFRGRAPVLVGLFRGLHCPFCRRHIAAMARLDPALRANGVETFAVVNTPIDRARLYFRYHPQPNLLAAADPERASHRAFGLQTLNHVESAALLATPLELPGETKGPVNARAAIEILNKKDRYEITENDQRMISTGGSQLVGEFLLDRDGIVRWSFIEAAEGARHFLGAPTPDEVMSAAAQVAR